VKLGKYNNPVSLIYIIQFFSLVILFAFLITANQAFAGDMQEYQAIYDSVVKTLKQANSMEFDFTRILKSEYTGACDTSYGNVKIDGDNLSRVTIDNRIIITRSDTVWDYLSSHNQLTISLQEQTTIKELFISDYLGGYKVTGKDENATDLSLLLTSIGNPNKYQDVSIALIKSKQMESQMPKRISYRDESKRDIVWEFGEINLKTKFDQDIFTFKIPDKCRVVNLIER